MGETHFTSKPLERAARGTEQEEAWEGQGAGGLNTPNQVQGILHPTLSPYTPAQPQPLVSVLLAGQASSTSGSSHP